MVFPQIVTCLKVRSILANLCNTFFHNFTCDSIDNINTFHLYHILYKKGMDRLAFTDYNVNIPLHCVFSNFLYLKHKNNIAML